MSLAKMTLLGFYNYLDAVAVDLFEGFNDLPKGIDKDTLADVILLDGGEFEVTYADPYFLKFAIPSWVEKWRRTFEKWVAALSLEYDPISNYDRQETWTDEHTGTVKDDGTGKDTSGGWMHSKTDGEHDGTTGDTTTTKVSAYDANDFANRDQVVGEGSDHSEDNTTTESSDERTTDTENHNTRTNNLKDTRTGRVKGNIGVTTSQQMLMSELDLAEWNLYQHIADLFLKEFTIMVYE